MTEIEKMKRYIDRTRANLPKAYGLNLLEGLELSKKAFEATDLPLEVICLAFNYGQAKGYRAAKAEMKEAI